MEALWAELFIIANSRKVDRAIDWWSVRPNDRVDFQNGHQEIEIKSSSSGLRVHTFSQEQIPGSLSQNYFVGSIILSQSDGGTSLSDLVVKIRRGITQQKIRTSFESKLFLRTGGYDSKWDEVCFDERSAKSALLFFRGMRVPRVRVADRGVVRVRSEVELDDRAAMSRREINKASGMIRDLSP